MFDVLGTGSGVSKPATATLAWIAGTNTAPTVLLAASSVTVQVALPLQAPFHIANTWLTSGVAVSITGLVVKVAEQFAAQLIPAGAEVTVPPLSMLTMSCALPVPCRLAAVLPPAM